MKIKILIATATTLISSALFAQEESSLTLSTAFNSDYYFRGTQLADSFIETAVDYTYGDFYAGLWYASRLKQSTRTWAHTTPTNSISSPVMVSRSTT